MSGQADQPSALEPSAPISYADTTTPSPREVAVEEPIARGDVAFVALRILAIYMILNGLSTIAVLAGEFSIGGRYSLGGILVSPALLWLIVEEAFGVFLFVSAARLSVWMLPKVAMGPATAPGGVASSDWQAAAFAVVGIALAVLAAPDIAFMLYQSIRSVGQTQSEELALRLVKPLVQLVLGIWLFFGSHRLALVWRKMRSSDRL